MGFSSAFQWLNPVYVSQTYSLCANYSMMRFIPIQFVKTCSLALILLSFRQPVRQVAGMKYLLSLFDSFNILQIYQTTRRPSHPKILQSHYSVSDGSHFLYVSIYLVCLCLSCKPQTHPTLQSHVCRISDENVHNLTFESVTRWSFI